MEAAMKDGIAFYISSNNVILTEGVDGLIATKYFRRVFKKDGTPILEEK
jgi:2'-phosphotransferase